MEQGSSAVKPGDAFLAKPAVIAFNDFEAEWGGSCFRKTWIQWKHFCHDLKKWFV